MNQKTCKLIRRFASKTEASYRGAKKAWKHMTRKQRAEHRRGMKQCLEDLE